MTPGLHAAIVPSGGSKISQMGVRQRNRGGGANLLFDQFSPKTA